LAQEESFYSSLVRDPRFAESVGNVVVSSAVRSPRALSIAILPAKRADHRTSEGLDGDAGWVPGPTSLGYVNFFVNVRAANLKLPPEHRIKVWWAKLKSIGPKSSRAGPAKLFPTSRRQLLSHNQRGYSEETEENTVDHWHGHLFGRKARTSQGQNRRGYPNKLAVVSPFAGYVEAECNERIAARQKTGQLRALSSS